MIPKRICYACYVLPWLLITMLFPRTAASTPLPDIKANNSDTVLELNTRDALSVTVSLSPGTGSGMSGDWWIAVNSPFGWYGYATSDGWYHAPRLDGLAPAYQGVLFSLATVDLLNVTGLPAGNYLFYFAVDTVMNGQLDLDHLFFDSVMVTISESSANIFYVATNGNDSNPGTLDAPWLTIQHAADSMNAGDTVQIRGGVYYENVTTTQSGSPSGNIVFSNYPGETPIIDGTGVDASNGFIIDQDYIKLSGLEIRNWNGNVIWVENAAYFEISDCVVYDATSGIGIAYGSHDFVLNRVTAHHFDLYGFDVSPSGGADCYNGTFNDCTAHTGRDREQNVDGFALGHGTQHDFVLNRCEAYNVGDGFVASSRDATLNRCSAHDCWTTGYKVWGDNIVVLNSIGYHNEINNLELDWDGQPGSTRLQNCTFMDSGDWNIWVENAGDSLNMYNCILAGGDNIGLAFEQMGINNYRGDFNIFHNDDQNQAIVVGYEDYFSLSDIASGAWTSYSGQDGHSIVVSSASELFVDPINYDLHLTATSPAIDKGTSVGAPSEDYEGNERPQGSGYDIGAYEY